MTDIFCKIISKEIPSSIVYEDDELIAFNDIETNAKIHILIVPKRHIAGVSELTERNAQIVSKMILKAKELAKKQGIAESGYRLVINSGPDAGQTVPHLHLHLLGGEKMDKPA